MFTSPATEFRPPNYLQHWILQNFQSRKSLMIDIHLGNLQRYDGWKDFPNGLAEALEVNQFVTEICICVDYPSGWKVEDEQQQAETIRFWNPLFQAMSKRSNLKTVKISNQNRGVHPIFGSFLCACKENDSIQCIELNHVMLHSAEICEFIDAATSITGFTMVSNMRGDVLDGEDGYRNIAAALQRNSNIQSLELKVQPRNRIAPILRALRSNTCLRTLSLRYSSIDGIELEGSLCQLLEETNTLRRLQLLHFSNKIRNFQDMERLDQAIFHSQSITELALHGTFDTNIFSNTFRQKTNLHFLSVRISNISNIDALCAGLIRSESPIRSVHFDMGDVMSRSDVQRLTTILRPLLRSVCRSKVVRFRVTFGDNYGRQYNDFLRILIQFITSLKVQALDICFNRMMLVTDSTVNLLLATVKDNYCIKSMTCQNEYGESSFLQFEKQHQRPAKTLREKQTQKLALYMDRNTRLEQFRNTPGTVNKKLWPQGLEMVSKAGGPSSLYYTLRAGRGQPNLIEHITGVSEMNLGKFLQAVDNEFLSANILGNLNVKEVCLFGACNKFLQEECKQELIRRRWRWKEGTSKSWRINRWDGRSQGWVDGSNEFADDYPYSLGVVSYWYWLKYQSTFHTEVLVSGLPVEFENNFASTELQMYNSIAFWSKGWWRFLYNRETASPPCPPRIRNGCAFNRISVPGTGCCRPALIFDIHCNGKLMWSAIHPFPYDTANHTVVERVNGEDKICYTISLESTKTIGDATDAALEHRFVNPLRPNKYVLSTDPKDTRQWLFTVSIVSPSCSETCLFQVGLPLSDIMSQPEGRWAPTFDTMFLHTWHSSVNHWFQGIDHHGNFASYYGRLCFELYWDRRLQQNQQKNGSTKKEERLHVIPVIVIEKDLLQNMIANPPSNR